MKLRLNFKLIRSLIVLAALPLVGCTLGQFRKETSGSSGADAPSSTTGSAFRPSSDARKDVREAIAKLNTAYPYRLTETVSASGNRPDGDARRHPCGRIRRRRSSAYEIDQQDRRRRRSDHDR